MATTRIFEIQGSDLFSPMADQEVTVEGVVTGHVRRGYFLQDPSPSGAEGCSDGIFVYSPKFLPTIGSLVEVQGKVVDYVKEESYRPVTQIKSYMAKQKAARGPKIAPVVLTRDIVYLSASEQAGYLNSLESMVVAIESGATFLSPSNPYGDYVVLPKGEDPEGKPLLRSPEGGLLIDLDAPERWHPSFRIRDYDQAPQVNVGAILQTRIVGPLNYRANAFQVSVDYAIEVAQHDVKYDHSADFTLEKAITVMTLNGFNLDEQVERSGHVSDPRRDVDDDVGDYRFVSIARDILQKGQSPDIIALQEIQDNDGAEMTETVEASETYQHLANQIRKQGGPEYRWIDLPPEKDADGGQPGGNIRNGFMFRPDCVEIQRDSLQRLGEDNSAFVDSRKPLEAHFTSVETGQVLAIINVHLASKRHQHSIFAAEQPGFDPREPIRVEQAKLIDARLRALTEAGTEYYVTGDFNDLEHSETLKALEGEDRINLVYQLPPERRYDYNHRGKLQVLMHGIVSRVMADAGRAQYQILHGNELKGVQPGTTGTKPTDHAYVMAALQLS